MSDSFLRKQHFDNCELMSDINAILFWHILTSLIPRHFPAHHSSFHAYWTLCNQYIIYSGKLITLINGDFWLIFQNLLLDVPAFDDLHGSYSMRMFVLDSSPAQKLCSKTHQTQQTTIIRERMSVTTLRQGSPSRSTSSLWTMHDLQADSKHGNLIRINCVGINVEVLLYLQALVQPSWAFPFSLADWWLLMRRRHSRSLDVFYGSVEPIHFGGVFVLYDLVELGEFVKKWIPACHNWWMEHFSTKVHESSSCCWCCQCSGTDSLLQAYHIRALASKYLQSTLRRDED